MKILIRGRVVQFTIEAAVKLGVWEAIALQQLEYWLQKHEENGTNYHHGRYWNYFSVDEWHKQLPFISGKTIERTLKHLRDLGLVVVGNYNLKKSDQTLWYSIDYEAIGKFEKALPQIVAMIHTDKKRKP